MFQHILKVPSSQIPDEWFDFVKTNFQIKEKISELVVDFNQVRFLDTDDFVVLACLIEHFYLNGSKITFTGGLPIFNNHLDSIKFKEYWSDGFDREKFTLSRNHTTLCLWKINRSMIYSYSLYAREYFSRFVKDKDLIPLAANMDEVFNNIFDHSQSNISGYIITQYYPKNKKLSFSVCDFGIGIPNSIKSSDIEHNSFEEDWKAIVKSLERGFSIKSTPRNKGFGLNNILEFTESTDGKLLIISNNGFVEKRANNLYKAGDTTYDFQGTLVKVEVDLNLFEEKDDSDEIFDF